PVGIDTALQCLGLTYMFSFSNDTTLLCDCSIFLAFVKWYVARMRRSEDESISFTDSGQNPNSHDEETLLASTNFSLKQPSAAQSPKRLKTDPRVVSSTGHSGGGKGAIQGHSFNLSLNTEQLDPQAAKELATQKIEVFMEWELSNDRPWVYARDRAAWFNYGLNEDSFKEWIQHQLLIRLERLRRHKVETFDEDDGIIFSPGRMQMPDYYNHHLIHSEATSVNLQRVSHPLIDKMGVTSSDGLDENPYYSQWPGQVAPN
ncbi:hypothetical protein IE077_001694, partial [Cardiosporidium cionae]